VVEQGKSLDVVIAIDVSKSTSFPSLRDVDGDGRVGETPLWLYRDPQRFNSSYSPDPDSYSTDPDDSVLALELAAARVLAHDLYKSGADVGIVSFSGDVDPSTAVPLDPTQPDAWVLSELGSNIDELDSALNEILVRGPHGATNMGAAVSTSAGLLDREHSNPADQVIVVLTDGMPTLPVSPGNVVDDGDIQHLRSAVRAAQRSDIRTYIFSIAFVSSPPMPRHLTMLLTPVDDRGQLPCLIREPFLRSH